MLRCIREVKITSRQRVDWGFPGAAEWEQWTDVVQRVQIFGYEMHKFWGSHVQHDDLVNNTV